jgi:stage III sporulation protein AF
VRKKAEEMFSHDEYKIDDIRLTAEEQVRSEEDVKTISVYIHLLLNEPVLPL